MDFLKQALLVILGGIFGIISTIVVNKYFTSNDIEQKKRQVWPWKYTASEPAVYFPREINDSERDEISIHYQLAPKLYGTELVLVLRSTKVVNGKDFSVTISNKHANGVFYEIETVKFNNELPKLWHKILIPLQFLGPGANTVRLKNASPKYTHRWMFWDYASLSTKGGIKIWEIGQEDASYKEFHDLRFGFP